MSRRSYRTTMPDGRPVEVVTGWDRPLQHFFLYIQDLDKEKDDNLDEFETMVFTSLATDDSTSWSMGGTNSASVVISTILSYGLDVPPNLVLDLEHDQKNNLGNYVINYGRL